MTVELNPEPALALAARDVQRRYWGYVDLGDLMQEGWLWLYSHPQRIEKLSEMDSEASAHWFLRLEAARAMQRFARKEKASIVGYDVEDEQFYSMAAIRELLPSALLGTDKPSTDNDAPGSIGDPAESGGYAAMVMDVSSAWLAADLSKRDRVVVFETVVMGRTESAVAADLGVTQQAVSKRVKRVLRDLSEALGGSRPHPCGPTCECVDARLRLRPGVHGMDSGANQLGR